jgi:hypothetical protein
MLYKSRGSNTELHFFVVIKMSNYESYVISILKKEKISFVREKTYKDLRDGLFRFDFYLPNYHGRSVIVEVDGE